MKTKILSYLFLLSVILSFNSCKDGQDELLNNNDCPEMLYFNDMKEFNSELERVLQMSPEERKIWEKEKGFNSFGIKAEEVYQKTIQSDFMDKDEVKEWVKAKKKYLQMIEEDGNTILETQFYNNPLRYFMNEEEMFQIGKTVYRTFKKGTFCTDIENIEKLRNIDMDGFEGFIYESDIYFFTNFSQDKSASVGCGNGSIADTKKEVNGEWYMTKMQLEFINFEDYNGSYAVAHFKVSSYKRGVFWIYFNYESNITANAQLNVHFKSLENENNSVGLRVNETVFGSKMDRITYFQTSPIQGYDSKPYFLKYNCTANNAKTNDVTLQCSPN